MLLTSNTTNRKIISLVDFICHWIQLGTYSKSLKTAVEEFLDRRNHFFVNSKIELGVVKNISFSKSLRLLK